MPELEKKYDQLSQAVQVAYIGHKKMKKDTLCRSGVVWFGAGDIQSVDPRVASVLLKHKDVFIRAEDLEKHLDLVANEINSDTETNSSDNDGGSDSEDDSSEGDSSEGDSSEDVERIEAIKNIILSLDTEDESNFTAKNKPKIEAVRIKLPDDFELTSKELNQAWAELNATS